MSLRIVTSLIPPESPEAAAPPVPPIGGLDVVSSETIKDLFRALDKRDCGARAEARWRLPKDERITGLLRTVDAGFREPLTPSSTVLLLATWIQLHLLRRPDDAALSKYDDPLGIKDQPFDLVVGDDIGLVMQAGLPIAVVITPSRIQSPGTESEKDKQLMLRVDEAYGSSYDLEPTGLPFLLKVKASPDQWPERSQAIAEIKKALADAILAALKR